MASQASHRDPPQRGEAPCSHARSSPFWWRVQPPEAPPGLRERNTPRVVEEADQTLTEARHPSGSAEAEQSASRQLGRKGEWKGGSFEQGGARPAGRAFDQSVGRWSGRYTSADGSSGRAEHWKTLALTQQRTCDANEGLNDVTTSVSSRHSRSFVFAYVTIM